MKKTYIMPETRVTQVQTCKFLATSFGVDNTKNADRQYAKGDNGWWDEDED